MKYYLIKSETPILTFADSKEVELTKDELKTIWAYITSYHAMSSYKQGSSIQKKLEKILGEK